MQIGLQAKGKKRNNGEMQSQPNKGHHLWYINYSLSLLEQSDSTTWDSWVTLEKTKKYDILEKPQTNQNSKFFITEAERLNIS